MLLSQEELEELQAVVDAEREKFSHQRKTVQREITTRVTEVQFVYFISPLPGIFLASFFVV